MIVIQSRPSVAKIVIRGSRLDKVIAQSKTRLQVVQSSVSGGGGGSVSTYSWSPPSASATWVVPHNLNRHPSVTVVDSQDQVVGCKVTYLSLNVISIEFSVAVIGTVYLN